MSDPARRNLEERSETERKLGLLMASQRLAALATVGRGEPYLNLVAFAVGPDLKEIFLATPRATRKYDNLVKQPKVALLVDNRDEAAFDLEEGVAVTALGEAEEVGADRRREVERTYLTRHPQMKDFIADPGTALFSLRVERYICVFGLGRVISLEPSGPEQEEG